MNKIYVLDTNVLIHNPQAIFSFGKSRIAIPITVIEEIDNFKKNVDEKGRNARQIARYLDKLRKKGSLREGVKIKGDGILQVAISHQIEKTTNEVLFNDKNDNLIIGTALYLKEKNPDSRVILVSKDANVRIKADAIGLDADNYETDKVNFEELYTGSKQKSVDSEIITYFKEKQFITNTFGEFFPNQFVKFIDKNDEKTFVHTKYSKQNNSFYPLNYYKNQLIFGIKAKNEEQMYALEALLDPQIKLVSMIGKAGTGKTLLALSAGLNQVVEQGIYKRLVVSRPISPLGKDLGYLPGTKEEKFNPWMQPIYDNMEILLSNKNKVREKSENDKMKIFGKKGNLLQDFMDYDFIQLEPLTYIRGRSLPEQFLVIDEAQNLTPHEMKTIITRAGEGTKVVITGDPYQIDIPYLDSESNGLSVAVEKLKNELIVGHITLEKGERSELADLAAKFF